MAITDLNRISTSTPIISNEYPLAKFAGYYMWFGGLVAVQNEAGRLDCRGELQTTNWVATTLKVASMVLSCGLLPLMAMIYLNAFRSAHNFHWDPDNELRYIPAVEEQLAPEVASKLNPDFNAELDLRAPKAGAPQFEELKAPVDCPERERKILSKLLTQTNTYQKIMYQQCIDVYLAQGKDPSADEIEVYRTLIRERDERCALIDALTVGQITAYYADSYNEKCKPVVRLKAEELIDFTGVSPILKGYDLAIKLDELLFLEAQMPGYLDWLKNPEQEAKADEVDVKDIEIAPQIEEPKDPNDCSERERQILSNLPALTDGFHKACCQKGINYFLEQGKDPLGNEIRELQAKIQEIDESCVLVDRLSVGQITKYYAGSYNEKLNPPVPLESKDIFDFTGISMRLTGYELAMKLHWLISQEVVAPGHIKWYKKELEKEILRA